MVDIEGMVTKRGPIVKQLRKFIAQFPPANIAPWVKPNNKMKKLIQAQFKGRLTNMIEGVQNQAARRHLERLLRSQQRE